MSVVRVATFTFVLLLTACQHPRTPLGVDNQTSRIAGWLEREITQEEARTHLVGPLERLLEQLSRVPEPQEQHLKEQQIIAKARDGRLARLNEFLSQVSEGDELWEYRLPGGLVGQETGIAIRRAGTVVAFFTTLILD